jgi:hypothetical protein
MAGLLPKKFNATRHSLVPSKDIYAKCFSGTTKGKACISGVAWAFRTLALCSIARHKARFRVHIPQPHATTLSHLSHDDPDSINTRSFGWTSAIRWLPIGSLWVNGKPGERLVRDAVTASDRAKTDVPSGIESTLCVCRWAL